MRTTTHRYLAIAFIAMLMIVLLKIPSIGGPGESDDPVVSLSYLDIVSRFGEVDLRANDEIELKSGTMFILFDGKAELRGVGDYYLIDLTIGKKFKREKALVQNHLYVVSKGSNIFLKANDSVSLLMKGGDSGPLRRGM